MGHMLRKLAKDNEHDSVVDHQALDFIQIESRIARQIERFPASANFSLAELARLTGEPQANLLYLEKKFGLLSPVFEQRDRRQVRRYTLADLKKALFVAELKKTGRSVAQCVAMWYARQEGRLSGRESEPVVVPAIMNHIRRTRAQVLARFLQIVLQSLCGDEAVPNALIVVERVSADQAASPASSNQKLSDQDLLLARRETKTPVVSLLWQYASDPLSVALGWSAADGEVFTHFQNIEVLEAKLSELDLFCVEIPDENGSYVYQVHLGISQDGENLRLLNARRALKEGSIKSNSRSFTLIQILLKEIWNVVLRLEEIVRSELSSSSLGWQPDMLSVLAESVVAGREHKWDYCGIMTPVTKDALAVSMATRAFPVELRGPAPYPVGTSLVGWVYRFGKPLVVNQIVPDDPRFPFQALENPKAAAAFPASPDPNVSPRGVLYVGTRRLPKNEEPFNERDQMLLDIYGRLAGEMLARRDMIRRTVAASQRAVSRLELPEISRDELRETLVDLLRLLESYQAAGYVVLFAVRIGAYEDLRRLSPEIASWVMKNIKLFTYQVLAEDEDIKGWPGVNVKLVLPRADQEDSFAALVAPINSPLKKLRQKLTECLEEASHLGMKAKTIDPMVWSLPFAFHELQSVVKERGYESSVDELISRLDGALRVLPFIREGDKYLSNGQFDKARTQYELAHHHDPNNPYHLRHLAQCLIGAKKYDQAIKELEEAKGLESEYAGTYRHLAEAYLGKNEYDKAVESLEEAIKRNPQDPSLYLRLGEVLILRDVGEDRKRAIEMFREAMARDKADGHTEARYLAHMGRAYAYISQYDQAISKYEQALALDPQNEAIRFEMWLTLKRREIDAGADSGRQVEP